jgi:transketolase
MEMKHEPVVLILSRQALPTLDRSKFAPASGLRRGAYVLSDATNGKPDVLLIGTGSEVSLCLNAQEARVSVELAARFGWERYVGIDGARVGMRTFGESAPLQKLIKKFGFTVEDVVAAAIEQSNSVKG